MYIESTKTKDKLIKEMPFSLKNVAFSVKCSPSEKTMVFTVVTYETPFASVMRATGI